MAVTVDTDKLRALFVEALREAARIGSKAAAATFDSVLEDVEGKLTEGAQATRRTRSKIKNSVRRR